MANDELFVEVLAQIEREPYRWNQRVFAAQTDCGTAHCFAGWAAVLNGLTADFTEGAACVVWGDEPPQTNVLTDGRQIEEVAQYLLDLDEAAAFALFDCDNDLKRLYELSAEFTGLDWQVLRDKVADRLASPRFSESSP